MDLFDSSIFRDNTQGYLIVIVPNSATQNCHTTRSHTSTKGREDDETNKNLRKVNSSLHFILLFYPVDGENDKGKDHWDLLTLTPFRTFAI